MPTQNDTHDPKLGGLKQFQKFIDHDTVEYGLLRAAHGDAQAEAMTRRTLTAALKLVDVMLQFSYMFLAKNRSLFFRAVGLLARPVLVGAISAERDLQDGEKTGNGKEQKHICVLYRHHTEAGHECSSKMH